MQLYRENFSKDTATIHTVLLKDSVLLAHQEMYADVIHIYVILSQIKIEQHVQQQQHQLEAT
jgi:hypothetical protein